MDPMSQTRRFVVWLLSVAAIAAGVTSWGLGPSGGVAAGAVVVAAGSNGDAAARRGGERWGPPNGPEGGPAFALAVASSAPKILYVGTGRGVFRSTNGGSNWASAGLAAPLPPPPDGSSVPGVTSLAVDPQAPNTVYAGLNGRWDGGTTYGRPVFKTTDGGKTWRALDLMGQPVAISPT